MYFHQSSAIGTRSWRMRPISIVSSATCSGSWSSSIGSVSRRKGGSSESSELGRVKLGYLQKHVELGFKPFRDREHFKLRLSERPDLSMKRRVIDGRGEPAQPQHVQPHIRCRLRFRQHRQTFRSGPVCHVRFSSRRLNRSQRHNLASDALPPAKYREW
jgi:hypothetical protein